MSDKNTLNICLGHLPFPASHAGYIDLMIAPRLIKGIKQVALVDDSLFGQFGSSLSEYVQLFWLLEHLDEISIGHSYISIFHYRRFVSRIEPIVGQVSINQPWSTAISEDDLNIFDVDFSRINNAELFNKPVQFKTGMVGQYASAHILKDFLNFTNFLIDSQILSPIEAAEFLRENIDIPACTIGVYSLETFKEIFGLLRKASDFIYSNCFLPRNGYQRRSMGFLLERLNSYLILKRIRDGLSFHNFGYNIVISSNPEVSITDKFDS